MGDAEAFETPSPHPLPEGEGDPPDGLKALSLRERVG